MVIFTDHANLQYYRHLQKINHWVARYINFLEDFYYQLKHVPGVRNHADALSRCPNHDNRTGDNEQVVALPNIVFVQVLLTSALDTLIHQQQQVHSRQIEEWHMANKLERKGDLAWYRDQALVVIGEDSNKKVLLELYHNSPTVGHPRQDKMLRVLS